MATLHDPDPASGPLAAQPPTNGSSAPSVSGGAGFAASRGRVLATGLLALALAGVFLPVITHPSELLYGPRSDLLSFVHPYRALQNFAVREYGRFVLFDPLSFGGRPVVSDPQAGLFYPPNWLHLLDHRGEGEAFYGWIVLAHLLIGGIGVMAWLRDRGFAPPSQLAAALVFALYGKWIQQLLVQGHVVFLPLMWLPFACLFVDRLVVRVTPRRVAGLAAVAALVVLGSHPQIGFYVLVYAGVYAGFVLARRPRRARLFVGLLAAGLLGMGLAAVTWLPVLADLGEYVRGDGLDYADAEARALEASSLVSFALPDVVPREMEARPYAGVLLVPLALLGLVAGRRRRLAIACTAGLTAIGWYSLGAAGGLHTLLYHVVPGFDLFRIPSRVFLMAGLPLAALVAIGVEASGAPATGSRVRVAVGALALAGATLAVVRAGQDSLLLALAFAALALCLLPLPARARAALPWVCVGLVFLDLARFAAPLVETRPIEAVLGRHPVAERIEAGFGAGRVLAFNYRSRGDLSALPVTYTARLRIENLRGFNPLIPTATWALLVEGAGAELDPPPPRVTIPSFVPRRPGYLDAFDTRWLVTNAPLDLDGLVLRETFGPIDVHHTQTPEPMTTLQSTFLYENTRRMPRAALVREARWVPAEARFDALADWPLRSVVMVEDPALAGRRAGAFEPVAIDHRGDEIRIDVDAGAGAYLVLGELFRSGWSARDAKGHARPIHRANGFFQMIDLEAGRHSLTLRYRPLAYRVGAALSLLSLAVWCLCLWGGTRRTDA